MGKRKERFCRCCGGRMPAERLWICESCQAQGMTVEQGRPDVRELERVARAREAVGKRPLEGMSIGEISALAWTYRKEGYGSYGKLRGYVDATGRMPERRYYGK